jgi:hypothetical protein
LKIVGSIELEERSNDEVIYPYIHLTKHLYNNFKVLSKIMDYTIDEMETLRSSNEEKVTEIQRINGQLNKALEVNNTIKNEYFYYSLFLDS